MERKEMNIYQKLLEITAELSAVAKNLSVGEGRSSYKAVGEADVLAAVKPLEKKYGIYSYPSSRQIIDTNVFTSTQTYQGNTKETHKLFMRVETVYRFVNVDKPEEYVEVTTYGDGVDAQDKAPGKAMTYGDKYALLKAYKIITGDDPDQNKSEEGVFANQPMAPQLATQVEKKTFLQRCESLGQDYKQIAKQAGAVSMATMTKEQHGKALIILKEIEENR